MQPRARTVRQACRRRTWEAQCRGSRLRGLGAAQTPRSCRKPKSTKGKGGKWRNCCEATPRRPSRQPAVEQAYGEEGSPDQHERDRRAEGEERTTGTKAATRAAAAAEHIQEALAAGAKHRAARGGSTPVSSGHKPQPGSRGRGRTSGETWAAAAESFPDSSPGGGDPGRTSPTWRPADSRGAGRRGEQPMQHTCCGQDGTCAISYPSSWTRTQGRPHRRHSKSSTTGRGSTGDQNSWKSWTTTGRNAARGRPETSSTTTTAAGSGGGGQTLMYTYNRRCLRLRKKN